MNIIIKIKDKIKKIKVEIQNTKIIF